MKWHHLKFLIANKGIYENADIKSNSKQRRRQVHFMRVEDVATGNKVENCKSSEGKVGANMSNFEFQQSIPLRSPPETPKLRNHLEVRTETSNFVIASRFS
jgi:hypothetical protein